jgi:hypothetical protein
MNSERSKFLLSEDGIPNKKDDLLNIDRLTNTAGAEKIINGKIEKLNSLSDINLNIINKSQEDRNFKDKNEIAIQINQENRNFITNELNINDKKIEKNEDNNKVSIANAVAFDDASDSFNENFKIDDLLTLCIEVKDSSKCYLTLHQPQLRFKENIKDYKIPLGFIIVAKYFKSSNSYIFRNSEFINWEKLIVECYLSPGEYHIFAKSYWCFPEDYELVVSTYSNNPIRLFKLTNEEYPFNWLENIMTDIAKKNPEKIYFCKNEIDSFASNILFNKKIFQDLLFFIMKIIPHMVI